MQDESTNSIIDQLKSEIDGEFHDASQNNINKDVSNDSAGSGENFKEVLDKYFNEVDEDSE